MFYHLRTLLHRTFYDSAMIQRLSQISILTLHVTIKLQLIECGCMCILAVYLGSICKPSFLLLLLVGGGEIEC